MCGWVEEFFLLISLGFPPTGLPSPSLFSVSVSLRYGGCGGGQISPGFGFVLWFRFALLGFIVCLGCSDSSVVVGGACEWLLLGISPSSGMGS